MTYVYKPGDRRRFEIIVGKGEHKFTLFPVAGGVDTVVVVTSCKVRLQAVERLNVCGDWQLEAIDPSDVVPMRGWMRRIDDWLHDREELPIAEVVHR